MFEYGAGSEKIFASHRTVGADLCVCPGGCA